MDYFLDSKDRIIHTKFGTWISPDELKSLKNLEYDIEAQLELAQFA